MATMVYGHGAAARGWLAAAEHRKAQLQSCKVSALPEGTVLVIVSGQGALSLG